MELGYARPGAFRAESSLRAVVYRRLLGGDTDHASFHQLLHRAGGFSGSGATIRQIHPHGGSGLALQISVRDRSRQPRADATAIEIGIWLLNPWRNQPVPGQPGA